MSVSFLEIISEVALGMYEQYSYERRKKEERRRKRRKRILFAAIMIIVLIIASGIFFKVVRWNKWTFAIKITENHNGRMQRVKNEWDAAMSKRKVSWIIWKIDKMMRLKVLQIMLENWLVMYYSSKVGGQRNGY